VTNTDRRRALSRLALAGAVAVSVALFYLWTRPTTTTRERRVRKKASGDNGPEQESGDNANDNEDKASQDRTLKDGTKKSGGAKKVWKPSRQEWKNPEANQNQQAEQIEPALDMDTLMYALPQALLHSTCQSLCQNIKNANDTCQNIQNGYESTVNEGVGTSHAMPHTLQAALSATKQAEGMLPRVEEERKRAKPEQEASVRKQTEEVASAAKHEKEENNLKGGGEEVERREQDHKVLTDDEDARLRGLPSLLLSTSAGMPLKSGGITGASAGVSVVPKAPSGCALTTRGKREGEGEGEGARTLSVCPLIQGEGEGKENERPMPMSWKTDRSEIPGSETLHLEHLPVKYSAHLRILGVGVHTVYVCTCETSTPSAQ
jgi:hypothetical protein